MSLKYFCITLFTFSFVLTASLPCEGATWRLYARYKLVPPPQGLEKGFIKSSYESETLVKNGTVIRVWTKTTIPVNENNMTTPSVVLALIEINCSQKMMRILKVLKTYRDYHIEDDVRRGNWDYITPEGMSEALYKAVCKKEPQKRAKRKSTVKTPCK